MQNKAGVSVLLISSFVAKSVILRAIALGLMVYVGLCVLLFVAQRRFLYMPSSRDFGAPPGFERWTSMKTGEPWGYKRVRGTRECLFFFHGNGGNASGWSHAVAEFPGDIYVLEYPGYGDRPGRPSERAIKEAAREAFRAEHARCAQVVAAGQSLGSAVTPAIFEAWPEKIHALVLITPLLSVREMARDQFWFIPTNWLLRDPFDLFKPWTKFGGRTQIVIAGADEIVPRRHGLAYLESAKNNSNVTVLELAGISHNSVELNQEFWSGVLAPHATR